MPESHHHTAPSPDSRIPTFEEAATAVLAIGAQHLQPDTIRDHRHVLEEYVIPHIGTLSVSDLAFEHVLDALRPIWHEKPAQARKARARLRDVLEWACATGFRPDTLNFDLIASALGPQPRPSRRPVLPYSEVSLVFAAIRGSGVPPSARLALEFLVLTAARTGEVCEARWDEMDLECDVWTVPADRMKSRRDHRVPLSTQAKAVLAEARALGDDEGFVFRSSRGGPLSASSLSTLLHRLGIKQVPHSFRTNFRDWCAESGIPREVAECCTGHSTLPPVEAALCRSDLLSQRREVMEAWGSFVSRDGSTG